jgi:hypothetical protein
MSYRFALTDGSEATIYFSHKGGKKGDIKNPGKAPHVTKCSIITTNHKLLGEGQAAPLRTVLEELPVGFTESAARKMYRNRLKKITVKDDGKLYAVLKGDMFCRAEGRKRSLKKALVTLPKEDRLGAWIAIGEITVEDDKIIDLVDKIR